MKKIIAPLLVLTLLLTGCQTVVKDSRSTEETTKPKDQETTTEATTSAEETTAAEETTESEEPDSGALKNGMWNLTDVSYFSYEGQYVSRQNGYYMFDEYFKGDIGDGFIRFELYGGYQGPEYDKPFNPSVATFVVECSNPEQYYAPGADVMLTLRCETDNSYGETLDPARVYFSSGNGKATGDRFFGSSIGYFADKDGEDWSHKWNTSTDLFAKFPQNAENGDEIAIVFSVPIGYDSYGTEFEDNYGGYMFYVWIYTYIA